jgi:hypothetical protein
MKQLPKFSISTPSDVLAFFLKLSEMNILLDPDLPFEDYVLLETNMEKRSFTAAEAHQLDTKMDECFRRCDEYGVDLYGIAVTMAGFKEFQKERRQRGQYAGESWEQEVALYHGLSFEEKQEYTFRAEPARREESRTEKIA